MNAVNGQGAQIMVVSMPNGQLMQLQPVGQAMGQAQAVGQTPAQVQAAVSPQTAPPAYNTPYQGETMHMR